MKTFLFGHIVLHATMRMIMYIYISQTTGDRLSLIILITTTTANIVLNFCMV